MRRLMIARHWFQDGGFRMIVVLKRGPKWARVLDAGTLRAIKIPSNDLDLYAEPLPVSPRKLAKRIDHKRMLWRDLDVFTKARRTDKAAREAVKLLRQEARAAT
jgi:hypothetical protein